MKNYKICKKKKKNRIEANIFVVANLKPCKSFWPGQVLEYVPMFYRLSVLNASKLLFCVPVVYFDLLSIMMSPCISFNTLPSINQKRFIETAGIFPQYYS